MKKLNEYAAAQFESGDDQEVNNGLVIMNELIVPCLPLLLVDETEEKDIVAVEDMRNRWCSYLGQEMERKLLLKLASCMLASHMGGNRKFQRLAFPGLVYIVNMQSRDLCIYASY